MAKQETKIASIGLGLAGANISQALQARLGGSIGLINLSDQDLRTSAVAEGNRQLLLGGGKLFGAGKNRQEAARQFGSYAEKILDSVVEWSAGSEILFVCASAAGGTGSGLIPQILAMLFSGEVEKRFAEKKAKPPIIFAVVATPDTNEGIKSQSNAVELLRDFDNMITRANIGRFILVNNQFGITEKTDGAKYTRVNEAAVGVIARYLEDFGSSREGCLDRADRFSGLGIPGIHAFFSFGDDGRFETPFIMPEGASVTAAMAEIKEGFVLNDALARWGLTVGDTIKGYFTRDENLVPIVHLAGFQNFKKLAERFSNQVELLKARTAEAKGVNETQGVGLRAISETRAHLTKEYTPGKIDGLDSLGGLFDE